jgi:hypothetical protein
MDPSDILLAFLNTTAGLLHKSICFQLLLVPAAIKPAPYASIHRHQPLCFVPPTTNTPPATNRHHSLPDAACSGFLPHPSLPSWPRASCRSPRRTPSPIISSSVRRRTASAVQGCVFHLRPSSVADNSSRAVRASQFPPCSASRIPCRASARPDCCRPAHVYVLLVTCSTKCPRE